MIGRRTLIVFGGILLLGAVTLSVAWYLRLPEGRAPRPMPQIPASEVASDLTNLHPPHRARPLIAIIAINDATETTDYIMTYGILKRAGVADVVALAVNGGAVKLYPALTVAADTSVAQFDAQHPDGADYVIVPAMSRDDDPAVSEWLRSQARKGAIVIGVCAGAKVVGAAGLLDGKRATTHWYFRKSLLKVHPSIRYVPDRRFVVDGRIVTTTGISASMPMMLTLIQAIAGRTRARQVAIALGVDHWDARHDSGAFQLSRPFVTTILANSAAFWKHDKYGLQPRQDVDEVSLALVADAWSRTYRSRIGVIGSSAVRSRQGLLILPDSRTGLSEDPKIAAAVALPPAQALSETLTDIGERFGKPTQRIVAMQLEYPAR